MALALATFAAGTPARAFEAFEGAFQLHGFYRADLRYLNDGFERKNHWHAGAFAHILNLEFEWDIAPDGWGPFDTIGAYGRVEVRFDCVWSDGCGMFNSRQIFGDKADHAPYKRLTNARFLQKSGTQVFQPYPQQAHEGRELVEWFNAPAFQPLLALGEAGLLRVRDAIPDDREPVVGNRKIDGGFDEYSFTLGPWNRNSKVRSLATLRNLDSLTPPTPLRPTVPAPGEGPKGFEYAQGTWVPHVDLRKHMSSFDDIGRGFDLRESELRWNHGQSQDEKELKEAYLDLEMFDGRLFLRVGKQTIVWGKTELFRNQDQFNPQDVGLALLPSLEESRTALWAVRGIYSFYNVGPFEDVRVELAVLMDEFEPIDAGTCGEPYGIWLVCAGSFGFFAHGLTGLGVAGVDLPPNPWNSWKGVEVGGRLEFRYGRFSFALTDYYGFNDIPTINRIVGYDRRVDPRSGRPLDALNRPYEIDPDNPEPTRDQALNFHSGNRQLYEFVCALSLGVADFIPELANDCAIGVFSNNIPLAQAQAIGFDLGVAEALGMVLSGSTTGAAIGQAIVEGGTFPPSTILGVVPLNKDFADGLGPAGTTCAALGGGIVNTRLCLSSLLTDEQEALLGCGPFYGTNCDTNGIDLFNAEASALFQAIPFVPEGAPVATRFVDGWSLILPGARGPADEDYDPRVDGCVSDEHENCAGAVTLTNPTSGEDFTSEMQALSFNFLQVLAAFGAAQDPDCVINDPITCSFVRGILNTAGTQREAVRAGGNGVYGRLDFLWHAGGALKIQFNKRNVLGLAMDFSEDVTKTNWGIEFTWFENEALGTTTDESGFRKVDVYNLTVSVDRPTFINFLNNGRTFFFNSQWFFQYVPEYKHRHVFGGRNGNLNVLATFTVLTAYFQDRLQISGTYVHDFRSASGAFLWNATYRFTANFSAELSLRTFYGGPQDAIQSQFPVSVNRDYGDFKSRTAYNGLSILAEKDEIGLTLRYSF